MNLTQSLIALAPEFTLVGAILLVLVADLYFRGQDAVLRRGVLTLISLAGVGVAAILVMSMSSSGEPIFSGMLAHDGFAKFFRLLFLLVAAFGLLFAGLSDEVPVSRFGEYALLLLSITLGLSLLAGARNLLMIYLSIELVSLPSYVLAGFRRGDYRASEAALKYVIYGGVASGLMLYGFSLLYGLTGTLDLTQIGGALQGLGGSAASRLALTAAVLMSLCGFGYKVAAVPFHMWCPDVYQGAPTPFTAFLSVGPKAAGLAVLMRFMLTALGDPTGAAFPWPLLIGLLAAVTMTLGNLTALVQNNVKRLLAFSSIAHAGYLLMAVSVGSPSAIRAVELYLVFYLLMNLGAFLAVQAVRARTGSEDLDAYRGLGARSPLLAVLLALFLFSLTGLPPLAGFIGKFYLFASLLEVGNAFYYVLALIGVLNSAISLYYYARVMKAMYLKQAGADATPVPLGGAYSVLLLVLAVPTLILGVYWFPLADALNAGVALTP